MKRSPLLILLLVVIALALPGTASAAVEPKACPADLTVAGIPLSAESCTDLGNGQTEIDHPVLLSNKVVEIQGTMILNSSHDNMTQKSLLAPLPLAVKDASGSSTTVLAGQLTVGIFRVCDVGAPFDATGGRETDFFFDNTVVATIDRMDLNNS